MANRVSTKKQPKMYYNTTQEQGYTFSRLNSVYYPMEMELSPEDFVDQYIMDLPVLMRVTTGYCGQNSIDFTFSSDETYLVTNVLTQERVILKDLFGQQLSFPTDHFVKFYTLINGVKSEEAIHLHDIIQLDSVTMTSSTVHVIPDTTRTKTLQFCVGPDAQVTLNLDKMELLDHYDERFIVGNSIIYDKMLPVPMIIPLWMPITFGVADHMKADSNSDSKDFKELLEQLTRQSKTFKNTTARGNKEIMLFIGDLGEYDGIYDIIQPSNSLYSCLPPKRDIASDNGPPPPVLGRVPRPDPSHALRPPPGVPKDVKSKKKSHEKMTSFFNKLKPGKSKSVTDIHSDSSKADNCRKEEVLDSGENEYSYARQYLSSNSFNTSSDGYVSTKKYLEVQPQKGHYDSDSEETYEMVSHETKRALPPVPLTAGNARTNVMLKNNTSTVLSHKEPPKSLSDSSPVAATKTARSISTTEAPTLPPPVVAPKPGNLVRSTSTTEAPPLQPPVIAVKPINPGRSISTTEDPSSSECEYASFKAIPTTLKGMSVTQVSDCLRLLKLNKHIVAFLDEDVDGDLLESLEEKELIETFNLSSYEAKKLLKFKNGWRPHTTQ